MVEKLYYNISEVAQICRVKDYNIRYWEKIFTQLTPQRRHIKRQYTKKNIEFIQVLRYLLAYKGLSLSEAQDEIKDNLSKYTIIIKENLNKAKTLGLDYEESLIVARQPKQKSSAETNLDPNLDEFISEFENINLTQEEIEIDKKIKKESQSQIEIQTEANKEDEFESQAQTEIQTEDDDSIFDDLLDLSFENVSTSSCDFKGSQEQPDLFEEQIATDSANKINTEVIEYTIDKDITSKNDDLIQSIAYSDIKVGDSDVNISFYKLSTERKKQIRIEIKNIQKDLMSVKSELKKLFSSLKEDSALGKFNSII